MFSFSRCFYVVMSLSERREENDQTKRAKDMPVKGRRSVGRQRIRWMDVVGRDLGGSRTKISGCARQK